MTTIDLILLGIVIASNNLSFAIGMGALGTAQFHLRIVLIFTLTEFTVPLIGLFLGQFVRSFISDYADIVGSLILVGLGILQSTPPLRVRRKKRNR